MRILPLLVLLVPLLAGCGDDLSSFEGVVEAKADAYGDLADVLDSIKDKPSAEAARARIEAIMKRIKAADEAGMKLVGELNIQDMEKLGPKLDAAEKKKTAALARLMDRIKDDAEAQAAVNRVLR